MIVRNKVLYFRPPQSAAPPASTLSLGKDITEFSPRLSSLAQAGEVAVRGWNVKEKQAVVATEHSTPPSGPATARRAFGSSSVAILGQPTRDLAEAGPIARGQFNAMALAYVEGDVVAYGQAQLRAGTVVDIAGAGQRFSGRYYVTSVTHTMTLDQGYQTSFTVQRNAA
jgi:phage protein D